MFTQFQLSIGPFSFAIRSDDQQVVDNIRSLYAAYPFQSDPAFADFSITITTRSLIRRWIKPQIDFFLDEFAPFKPLPKDQSFAMLEWGMNWCIATKAHQFLILHSGVIEKNGNVIVMPAEQGSGKSTLVAAMAYSGWRLFSDELGLISLADRQVYPCTRPINLKNNSIKVISDYVDGAVFSHTAKDTHKGTVALLKPPLESVEKMLEPAALQCFVFPKYVPGSIARLQEIGQMDAFQRIIDQSFNYHVLGGEGFHVISYLLQNAKCYTFEYSDFEQADQLLSGLVS